MPVCSFPRYRMIQITARVQPESLGCGPCQTSWYAEQEHHLANSDWLVALAENPRLDMLEMYFVCFIVRIVFWQSVGLPELHKV